MADKAQSELTNVKVQSKQSVITTLEEKAFKFKVFKVVERANDTTGDKYYLISAQDMQTKQTRTLSMSLAMVDTFGFASAIHTGVNLENPAYLHINAVFVPNDGQQYGYEDKKTGEIREYRNKDTYIVRQVTGRLSASEVRDFETLSITGDSKKATADMLFQIQKGKPYLPGINPEDDVYYMEIFLRA